MIRFARRTAYFDKNPDIHWMTVPNHMTYDKIKFIQWVFEVDGIVYTHCIAGFKEEFNKARLWSLLKADE